MESGNASARDLTVLLHAWREGQPDAREELVRRVYPQLRSLASRYLSSEKPGHTLNATGLVHEAFLKIVGADISWADRAHFFAISARVMRQILVDHARKKLSQKRGSGDRHVSLDDVIVFAPERSADLVVLDEGLSELATFDPSLAQIVELHFFGGLTYEEIAEYVGVSRSTVIRDIRIAQTWLKNYFRG